MLFSLFVLFAPNGSCMDQAGGITEIIIVFENWYLEDIEKEAKFFFSRAQVMNATHEIKGFRQHNKDFCAWLERLKEPGFHVYPEGYADQVKFISYLIGQKGGWICCGLQGSFMKTDQVGKSKFMKNRYYKSWWIDPNEKKRLFPEVNSTPRLN